MDDLERYIERHVTPEDPLLAELDRETHLRVVQPRMISGHLQGRLLEMVVRMIRPQRILEIGTFTGYSAICMARGLGEGGELTYADAASIQDYAKAASCIRSKRTTNWNRSHRNISSAAGFPAALRCTSVPRSISLRRSAYSI